MIQLDRGSSERLDLEIQAWLSFRCALFSGRVFQYLRANLYVGILSEGHPGDFDIVAARMRKDSDHAGDTFTAKPTTGAHVAFAGTRTFFG